MVLYPLKCGVVISARVRAGLGGLGLPTPDQQVH